MFSLSGAAPAPRAIVLAGLVALAAAACGQSGLSDEKWQYCSAVAPQEELDAAAKALNIQPNQEPTATIRKDRNDPTFVKVCEYAYSARNGNLAPGGANPPDVGSPTAPLGPEASVSAVPAASSAP